MTEKKKISAEPIELDDEEIAAVSGGQDSPAIGISISGAPGIEAAGGSPGAGIGSGSTAPNGAGNGGGVYVKDPKIHIE